MSKNLPSDTFIFEEENLVNSFKQALEQGYQFVKQCPESHFEIFLNSKLNQLKLTYERASVKADFAPLFGPGAVPGLLTDDDMLAIQELSEKLPESGIFVEVGAFLGKSAVEWARNLQEKQKDYMIICIDSFNSPIHILKELLIDADFDLPPGDSQLDWFKYYTKDFENIQALEVFFNKDYVFDIKLAGVFEDSDHTQIALQHALPYWWEKIIPGGILSGHDYRDEVKLAVDQFALLNNLKVRTFATSSIWYIEKN
jgi:hypothetical protein